MVDLILPDAVSERLWAATAFRRLAGDAADGDDAAEVEAVFLDAGHNRIGEPVPIEPDPAFIEAFSSDGSIAAIQAFVPIRLPPSPERGAVVQVLGDGGIYWEGPTGDLARRTNPMPAVEPTLVGPAGARLKFPVFSERFVDEDRFLLHVRALRAFIIRIPPFDALQDQFALLAFYWRAPDTVTGWFNTRDIPDNCGGGDAQVMHGNLEQARSRLVHLMLDGKFGLVLIDSGVRGGAGGLEDWQYPAWATITPCKDNAGVPTEHWEAIALHEIGHALGLCDEYLSEARKSERPRGEPNVTRQADAAAAGWSLPVNRPGNPTSIADFPGEDRAAVGTYRGCRYRTDLYRSAPHCLMRSTNILYFCNVCVDHLSTKLG
ncbi:M64 family metallopeptidase [Sphingopyxis microcysteis]|uniref:M64 family metallopeptidase n=1 Tax=Sphingopyxis microcysteis TaxID=2484145 RepID=UPI0014476CE5|nr:M64 family metallopeptidase [Sphingopyxis microcysteis]